MKPKFLIVALTVSGILNVILTIPIVRGWVNDPIDRLGRLTRPVEIGEFGGSEVLFTLPRDLTVRDASPMGIAAIGQFEPHRFSIIVTTDDRALVDYTSSSETLNTFGEYYSVELGERSSK